MALPAPTLGLFLKQFDLEMLHFGEPFPLVRQLVVELFVQLPDLEFGLQIDPIIVFGSLPVFFLLPPLRVREFNAMEISLEPVNR